MVLIDPDVSVGDWVKSAIEKKFARVHVFQQADQGLSRIRQYLIRGETPLVLVSSETQIDPLSGIHGLSDFVKRLKAQSPRTVVLGLRDDDVAPSAMPSTLNGVLRRPSRRLLVDKKQPEGAAASQVLWRAVLEILTDQGEGAAKAKASGPASMRGLRDATAKLQDASSRGEVLPVVLDFASGALRPSSHPRRFERIRSSLSPAAVFQASKSTPSARRHRSRSPHLNRAGFAKSSIRGNP